MIGANADTVFRRLCQAMGREELADDPKFSTHHARGDHMKELDELIDSWTQTLDAKECLKLLEKHGVPSGMIYSAKEILEDPHYRAREMVVKVDHPTLGEFPMPGVVPKLSRTPGRIKIPGAEKLGKHNREVYGGMLRLTTEQIGQLREKNVI